MRDMVQTAGPVTTGVPRIGGPHGVLTEDEINPGYLDPAEVHPAAWAADPGTLVVPDGGEDLYRLR